MNQTTDPNHLYDLKGKLDASEIYHQSEVDDFARIFYQPNNVSNAREQGKLYSRSKAHLLNIPLSLQTTF